MMTTEWKWEPALWTDTFNEMLGENLGRSDRWDFQLSSTIENELTAEERMGGWKIHCSTSGIGQFRCSRCTRSWPSAQTTLLFHYRLCRSTAQGTVIMRAFGQECLRCERGYKRPGFSKEEVKGILHTLFVKIRKNCYGERVEKKDDSGHSERVKTKPHEKSLCEACHHRMCSGEDKSPQNLRQNESL